MDKDFSYSSVLTKTSTENMQTARDVPLFIRSEVTSSERRITPSWSIAQLKTKLEPITGIPSSSQKLTLKLPGQEPALIEASDEDSTHLDRWHLQAYAEIEVSN
jgi:tubulin-folding cofactor B